MFDSHQVGEPLGDACNGHGLHGNGRASGDVVNHQRQFGALADGNKIFHQTALRGLDVIGRNHEYGVGARLLRSRGNFERLGEGLRTSRSNNGNALRDYPNGNLYELRSLIGRQAAGLSCRTAHDYAMRTFPCLAFRQFGKLFQIDFPIPERRK